MSQKFFLTSSMSLPETCICPITGNVHKIVYKNQNKQEFINYINNEIEELKNNKQMYKTFAVHTDRSLKQFGFNDLAVIEIAQCFRDFPNLRKFKIDPKQEQYTNLEDGFIIIQPDGDIKKVLGSLFYAPRANFIFFDLIHEATVLRSNKIKVNIGCNIDGKYYSPMIDTSIRRNREHFKTLEDAASNFPFTCLENINAIKDASNYDIPKIIFECQNLSDDEIINKYAELLPYYSSRAALVALSVLKTISDEGMLKNIGYLIIQKVKKFNQTSLLWNEINFNCHLLTNMENHIHASWLYVNNLIVHKNEIQKIKPNFKYLPKLNEYLDYCLQKLGVKKDEELPEPETKTTYTQTTPFSKKLIDLKITGNLYDLLKTQRSVMNLKDTPADLHYDAVIQYFNNPLLMISIEATSQISDKTTRDEQFEKIFEVLFNQDDDDNKEE